MRVKRALEESPLLPDSDGTIPETAAFSRSQNDGLFITITSSRDNGNSGRAEPSIVCCSESQSISFLSASLHSHRVHLTVISATRSSSLDNQPESRVFADRSQDETCPSRPLIQKSEKNLHRLSLHFLEGRRSSCRGLQQSQHHRDLKNPQSTPIRLPHPRRR
jgi:hypothetical protein